MTARTLIGYGGDTGGKGAGEAQRSPTDSPDTLKSSAKARVLDLVCEGEVEGLVGGLKGVFFDGVPVQNADGSFNFKGVTVYDVKGTQAQEYIPGFPSAESETAVNAAVVAGPIGVTRTVTDPNVDAVRVTIEVPGLYETDASTGEVKASEVQIAIDVQSNGGGFVEQVLNGAQFIRGKCQSAYQKSFRVELKGSAPWDVRVRRVTPDASAGVQNATVWKSYTTVVDEKLSFPNSALCAVEVSNTSFQGSVPTRSYRMRGLKVRVPTNYDPATRAYTGTWDGTFKVAWTDNPAWCFYDLLTTKRYGLGRFIDAGSVDKWGLYTIARYCDELVPDGKGGTEPRFRCNLYLQTQEDAYRVISNLASVFRGMAYWASGSVYVAQDAPRDAEYLFTPANVVEGLFTYASSGRRARHTAAVVTWNDPDNHYRQAKELVTDEEALAAPGAQWHPTEVVALGCTSRGQAQRVGRWLLYTERLETETVTFRTGLEGALRSPGSIVKVQDPYRAGKRMGGRIVSASTTQVELDQDITLEAGKTYTLAVVLPSGAVEERALAALAPATYRRLTVASAFSVAPEVPAVWVLAASDLAPVLYRVLSVTEVEPHLYELTALRHEPGKFAEVEAGVKVQPVPTSVLPSSQAPQGLALGESLYKALAGVQVMLSAKWTQVPLASEYVVRWKKGDGNWSAEERVQSHFWELLDVTPGLYRVQVAADLNGLLTTFSEASYTVVGKTAPPATPTGFTATPTPTGVTLRWTAVPDLDVSHYEVRLGSTSWASASLVVGELSATSYVWPLPSQPSGSYTFRLKAVDTSGNYSTAEATVSVTTSGAFSGGNLASGVLQEDGTGAARALAKGHSSGLARNGQPVTFPVSYQNPPLVLLRGGIVHEPRSKWGAQGLNNGSETGAFVSTAAVYEDLAPLDLDAAGFTLRARLRQKGATTLQNANADASGNSLTAVGQSAAATLNSAPSGAAADSYTVHFKCSVYAEVGGGSFEDPAKNTATLTLAIDSSADGGSTWVERGAYSYSCSVQDVDGFGASATRAFSHEQKTLTVAGLTSASPADKFRLRVKAFAFTQDVGNVASFTAHLFHASVDGGTAAVTYATAVDTFASKTPDSDPDVYVYWEALEVS